MEDKEKKTVIVMGIRLCLTARVDDIQVEDDKDEFWVSISGFENQYGWSPKAQELALKAMKAANDVWSKGC